MIKSMTKIHAFLAYKLFLASQKLCQACKNHQLFARHGKLFQKNYVNGV